MTKSAFDTWFNAQHKHRTDSGFTEMSDEELKVISETGRIADRALIYRKLWDERQQAALYAWTAAKDLDK